MRRLFLAHLGVAVALLVPQPAAAATVECEELNPTYDICEVVYLASPGESNRLRVATAGGRVTFTDSVPLQAGRRCEQLGPNSARCEIGTEPVRARLGGRADRLSVRGSFGAGPELQADMGSGDDRFSGGPGSEGVEGGPGTDRLSGGAGDDSLLAGAGGGRQVLIGGGGDDDLVGGRGADRIYGGPGRDSLQGGGGADRLAGGGGIDQLSCGKGRERALLDGLDWVSGGCSAPARPRAAAVPLGDEFPEADLDFEDRLYEVGCPADAGHRCTGRVRVRHRGRLLLAGRFRARPGTRPYVRLETPRGFRRPAEPQRVIARVLVSSRDRGGRSTTRTALVPFLIDSEAGIE